MTVDINRDLDTPVPHLLLDVCRRNAGLNQERAERVAQIVEPELS